VRLKKRPTLKKVRVRENNTRGLYNTVLNYASSNLLYRIKDDATNLTQEVTS